MTVEDYMTQNLKDRYAITPLRGKSLLEWAKIWFKTDNDTFFEAYGFNFNPHEYPYLYDIARKEVYPNEREEIHIDLFPTSFC